jgi:AraC-like DNA-binding protein
MRIAPSRLERETVTPEPDASIAVRAFSLARFAFRWHFHPEVELTLITRGAGLRFVGDTVTAYSEGDLVLLGPLLPHTWQSESLPGGGGVRSVVAQFDPARLAPVLSLPEFSRLRTLLARSATGLDLSALPSANDARNQLRRLPELSPARRLTALLDLLLVLADTAQTAPVIASHGPGTPQPQGREDKLARVMRLLTASLSRDGSIPRQSALAAAIGMTAPAFSRFFHRRVGKPYATYANSIRLQKACSLLIESPQAITAIAYQSGFPSLSNFNRRFKELLRQTPRQYRKTARTP